METYQGTPDFEKLLTRRAFKPCLQPLPFNTQRTQTPKADSHGEKLSFRFLYNSVFQSRVGPLFGPPGATRETSANCREDNDKCT